MQKEKALNENMSHRRRHCMTKSIFESTVVPPPLWSSIELMFGEERGWGRGLIPKGLVGASPLAHLSSLDS
jgi:hypothetical protein